MTRWDGGPKSLLRGYVRGAISNSRCSRVTRCPEGELDIVALDGDELVFIEVRSLSSEEIQTPEASIRLPKRRHLRTAARWFIKTRRLHKWRPRFDVIAIVWPADGEPTIRHHRNAFEFAGNW